jgi:hypothetical protein
LFLTEVGEMDKNAVIIDVLDALNDKQGSELVMLGSRLKNSTWQSRVDVRSPAYTTRWTEIVSVKAI